MTQLLLLLRSSPHPDHLFIYFKSVLNYADAFFFQQKQRMGVVF